MKKRYFLAVCLVVLLLIAITACGSTTPAVTTSNNDSTETTKEPAMSTTSITTTPITEAPTPTSVTIDESFTIVCASSATAIEKEVANKIVTAMSHFGVTLSIQNDTTAQTGNEIIVGNTSRDESQNTLKSLSLGDYSLSICQNETSGVSLVLAATDDASFELAVKHLIINYLSVDKKATLPYTLSITHKKATVTIQENQLADYAIVYAKEGVMSDANIQCAKYADAARDFAKLVENFSGITLEVLPDTADLANYQHLILFGNTDRLEDNMVYSAAFYKRGSKAYTAKLLSNGNISLAGLNPVSTYAAGEAFLAAIAEKDNNVTELSSSGKKDIIHVACLGDSITFGTGSADPTIHSYPAYYQKMLGYDYYVEKYGAPSNSLIETDSPSYLNHAYFTKSAEANPDVVIVMLGTNDTRPTRWADSAHKDWSNPVRSQTFLASGDKLVANYRNVNPDVQIIFATCPYVPQAADWTANLINYGNPHIKQVAANNNCQVIDIFSYTKKNVTMFTGGDGLHLKDEKYEMLAQGFYELTKDIIKK